MAVGIVTYSFNSLLNQNEGVFFIIGRKFHNKNHANTLLLSKYYVQMDVQMEAPDGDYTVKHINVCQISSQVNSTRTTLKEIYIKKKKRLKTLPAVNTIQTRKPDKKWGVGVLYAVI